MRRMINHDARVGRVRRWTLEASNAEGVMYAQLEFALAGADNQDVDPVIFLLFGRLKQELDARSQGEHRSVVAVRTVSRS